ncbi:YmfQ family protein [Stutzerimonas decontaminans]|uniref:Phage tail protein n=1 Tax=Stutzerimonas stutzeri TaxID=316 RepID=A0A023WV00_STUST|nr:putative phage tail protein [Stutzerimonas decontaminans]AHY43816.1 phage tail protein [Stutzerimonas decontaminans]
MAMSGDDYRQQLTALLPPGPAWQPEANAFPEALLAGFAAGLASAHRRADDLVNEADPLTVHELVPDWERVMNLPDPCLGPSPALEDRKRAIRQRFAELGGQTPERYEQIAVSQGYANARVIERRAPRFGRARFGRSNFGTWAAQHMWTLYTGARLTGGRRFGGSYWGERFGANPAQALECLIRRAAPAHTIETILYEEAP